VGPARRRQQERCRSGRGRRRRHRRRRRRLLARESLLLGPEGRGSNGNGYPHKVTGFHGICQAGENFPANTPRQRVTLRASARRAAWRPRARLAVYKACWVVDPDDRRLVQLGGHDGGDRPGRRGRRGRDQLLDLGDDDGVHELRRGLVPVCCRSRRVRERLRRNQRPGRRNRCAPEPVDHDHRCGHAQPRRSRHRDHRRHRLQRPLFGGSTGAPDTSTRTRPSIRDSSSTATWTTGCRS
jgi:hypothetical protein